jgi:hypothetical protein
LPIIPGMPLIELIDVLTPTDLHGQPFRVEPGFAAIAKSAGPILREVQIVNRVGERVRLSTTSIPLRDEVGALVGVTVLVAPAGG